MIANKSVKFVKSPSFPKVCFPLRPTSSRSFAGDSRPSWTDGPMAPPMPAAQDIDAQLGERTPSEANGSATGARGNPDRPRPPASPTRSAQPSRGQREAAAAHRRIGARSSSSHCRPRCSSSWRWGVCRTPSRSQRLSRRRQQGCAALAVRLACLAARESCPCPFPANNTR
eukprot:scaffold1470_cov118-Isochrysis_galbana.AAC.8